MDLQYGLPKASEAFRTTLNTDIELAVDPTLRKSRSGGRVAMRLLLTAGDHLQIVIAYVCSIQVKILTELLFSTAFWTAPRNADLEVPNTGEVQIQHGTWIVPGVRTHHISIVSSRYLTRAVEAKR